MFTQDKQEREKSWYRVTLSDGWAKPLRFHCYVEAEHRYEVEQRAVEHCPMSSMSVVDSIASTEADTAEIRERVDNVTSPNCAIRADGSLIRRDSQ